MPPVQNRAYTQPDVNYKAVIEYTISHSLTPESSHRSDFFLTFNPIILFPELVLRIAYMYVNPNDVCIVTYPNSH